MRFLAALGMTSEEGCFPTNAAPSPGPIERVTHLWTDPEVKKRLQANPFLNRFATPP